MSESDLGPTLGDLMPAQRFATHVGQTPGRMPRASQRPDAMHGSQPVTTYDGKKTEPSQYRTYTRTGTAKVEAPYEKPVVLPGLTNKEPRDLLWADARFATDIMAEHALFFALLMPQEVAPDQREQAIEFQKTFTDLREKIATAGPPPASELRKFVSDLRNDLQPFIEYKKENHRAQVK